MYAVVYIMGMSCYLLRSSTYILIRANKNIVLYAFGRIDREYLG